MRVKNNLLLIFTGLFLLLIIGLAGYEVLSKQFAGRVRLPMVEGCKLNLETCTAELPTGGKISFEITPRPPNPAKILHLDATFHQLNPQSVRVSFEGRDMYMGDLEFELKPKESTGDPVEFTGNGGIFVCSYGVMPWVVLVKVQVGEKVYEAPFEFETIFRQPG